MQYRTNQAMVQTLNVDSLNQLTTATRTNTMTVSGDERHREWRSRD